MTKHISRRTLLVSGATAIGASVATGSALMPAASGSAATRWDRATGTTSITAVGDPVRVAALAPTTSPNVMQQVELSRRTSFFMTQSLTGTAPGRYTTAISRYPRTGSPDGLARELDSMTIIDGGHGLGLHVEHRLGRDVVWVSLQGARPQGDPNGGRLAAFRYSPGTWTIDTIPGGVWFAPQFPNAYGELQEAIYSVDWAKGYAVERMFDFHTGHQEQFTRRRIVDVLAGRDRPLGRMTLPVNPPTLQGFATVNGTFFRWVGAGNAGSGALATGDPMALEQYAWTTGERIATKVFPTLAQDGGAWRDGAYEPEGCSVFREADGTASLLVGVTTGLPGDHAWPVFAFRRIGAR